jgi:hypothetical protein
MKRTNLKALEKRLKKKTDAMIEERLKESLPALIRLALDHAKMHSVTGNTMNSYAVALWHDGKFVGFYSSYQELHKAPTRVTLKKGESYDLPYYWGGDENTGYTAPTGDRNYWGQEEAEDFLSFHFPRKNGWAFIVVAATDYAKYLEARGTANVLGGMQSELEGRGADVSDLMFG